MSRASRTLAAAVVAVVVATIAAAPQDLARAADAPKPAATTQALSNTISASRVVVVRGNSSEVDDEELAAGLNKRARELGAELANVNSEMLAELPQEQLMELYNGNWYQFSWGNRKFDIDLRLPRSARPAAREIADGMVKWIEEYVNGVYTQQRERAASKLDRQYDAVQQGSKRADHELREIREKLRALSGRTDVSPGVLESAISNTDQDLQKLELDLLAKSARREALEKQIADASKRIEQQMGEDAIAGELQKVAEIREQAAARVKPMVDAGQASQQDLSDVLATAAEARAKLLQRRRDAATEGGGSALEAFNKELMTLAIDVKELEAKVEYLKDRLPRLREAGDLLGEFERRQTDAAQARNALIQATQQRRQFDIEMAESEPPKVLIRESADHQPARPAAAPPADGSN